jgi:hypothetical protein
MQLETGEFPQQVNIALPYSFSNKHLHYSKNDYLDDKNNTKRHLLKFKHLMWKQQNIMTNKFYMVFSFNHL